MFTQDEINAAQPDNSPFAVILDDGEDLTLDFFATLEEAEAYENVAPEESRVYCGLGVNYDLYS